MGFEPTTPIAGCATFPGWRHRPLAHLAIFLANGGFLDPSESVVRRPAALAVMVPPRGIEPRPGEYKTPMLPLTPQRRGLILAVVLDDVRGQASRMTRSLVVRVLLVNLVLDGLPITQVVSLRELDVRVNVMTWAGGIVAGKVMSGTGGPRWLCKTLMIMIANKSALQLPCVPALIDSNVSLMRSDRTGCLHEGIETMLSDRVIGCVVALGMFTLSDVLLEALHSVFLVGAPARDRTPTG